MTRRPPTPTLFPYTTLSRSIGAVLEHLRVYSEPVRMARRCRDLPNALSLEVLDCGDRSEEHTSELQSHVNLVCRLLLEKKKPRDGLDTPSPRTPARTTTPSR